MSRATVTPFAIAREVCRSGKLATAFLVFAAVGLIIGPEWTEQRSAELAERDDCTPVVWQDAWTGTPRESAWQTLIEQGWELRAGTNDAQAIYPPGCESVR